MSLTNNLSDKNPLSGINTGLSVSSFKMHTETSNITGRLQPHQDELQLLGELAGVHMDVKVFRILVEFLNMGVAPNTIFSVLKSIRRSPSRRLSHSAHH